MSRRLTEEAKRAFVSRRSLLVASAIGATHWIGQGFASDPPVVVANRMSGGQTPSARTAVQRLVRPIASRTIRLKPISADFDGTIVQAIAADPRGELIAVAGDDHAIRILNSATLDGLATLQGHSDLIQTLQFDPGGNRLVSAGNDGQLILWNRNARFKKLQRFQGTPALACVRFSPDGREMAAVGFENEVYLIGQSKQTGRPKVECDCTDLRSVEYRGDGKILAVAGRSGDLHLFDRATNLSVGDFQIHTGRIHALRFIDSSPVVVSAGEDGNVVMFDTDKKQIVGRIKISGSKLYSVCILDDQHLAVAGSDNVIRVVNVALGRVVQRLDGHTGTIVALASSGALLFSGGYDATLRRWQLSGIQGDRDRIAERDNPLDR